MIIMMRIWKIKNKNISKKSKNNNLNSKFNNTKTFYRILQLSVLKPIYK